ncbi:MAG: DUF2723 domain-containing protein [Gemmatimonadota bacterium]|nr:DUF2723 domain-containing protein [Gemmatimonadota bacterium]MDH3368051.1 DUF2723 domain-containing protein [Gemmatimonadota bacterium]MDH3479580.1 DUF2723 domain-containing protein [Gemmatimonadota bacterium]
MTTTAPAAPALARERPPYLAAGIVFLAVLSIYLVTIAPTAQFWDTAEYIAAAKVLGIPHPPGSPLFVLLAHIWGMLPIVEHYALRINLFAAVTSALASGFLFLVADRFMRGIVTPRWARIAAAAAGILVGATSFTVWNQSVVNEKVYTVSLLSIALVLWLAVHWGDEPAGQRRDHWLVLIVYTLALSATNHLMGLLAAPAFLVYVEAAEAEDNFWTRLLTTSALLVLAGAAAILFKGWLGGEGDARLVLAMVLLATPVWYGFANPTSSATKILLALGTVGMAAMIGERAWSDGIPLLYLAAAALLALLATVVYRGGHQRLVLVSLGAIGVGVSVWVFLRIRAAHFPPINEGEPTNWDALKRVLAREQYQKGPLLPRQADIVWQYLNWVQYFTWQFAHDWSQRVRNAVAVLFGVIGLVGAVRHWQRDRRGAVAMTALMLTVTVLLVFYLDFKYGFSIRPDEQLLREVRERDYFFIASFQLWGVWVALGFGALLEGFAGMFRGRVDAPRAWALATPVLALALIPLVGNRATASRAGEQLPRDFAWDILQSVEPYGILVTAGDNDTFPLWYMQEVEGVRKDVLLVNTSLGNTEWHVRQIKRRPVFPFDSTAAIPLYQGRSWPRPTYEAVGFSYEEIDRLPPIQRVPDRSVFTAGSLRASIGTQYLERADILTLHLIQQNLGKRPVYISRTTGGWADRLGFTPYMLGQGMVRRIMPQPIETAPGIVNLRSLGWVDIGRTDTLLFQVYQPESAARERPRGWPDPPSEGILSLYALLYAGYAQYLSLQATTDSTLGADSLTLAKLQQATDIAERTFQQTSAFRR